MAKIEHTISRHGLEAFWRSPEDPIVLTEITLMISGFVDYQFDKHKKSRPDQYVKQDFIQDIVTQLIEFIKNNEPVPDNFTVMLIRVFEKSLKKNGLYFDDVGYIDGLYAGTLVDNSFEEILFDGLLANWMFNHTDLLNKEEKIALRGFLSGDLNKEIAQLLLGRDRKPKSAETARKTHADALEKLREKFSNLNLDSFELKDSE